MTLRLATVFLGFTVLANGVGTQSPERPLMPIPCRQSNATRDANNLWQQMFWAEEAGTRLDDPLRNALIRGLNSDDAAAQAFAVRALGRLEQPELLPNLAPVLSAKSPEARSEAANAVGQAVQGVVGDDRKRATAEAVRLLRARYVVEGDASVRGAICETLGRLSYMDAAEVRTIEKLLVDATQARLENGSLAERLGAVKGLESLMRQNVKLFTPADSTIARLRELTLTRAEDAGRTASGDEDPLRVRRLALLALAPHTAADENTLASALLDNQWEVRRLAVRLAAASLRNAAGPGKDAHRSVIRRGLNDADWHVRYEAVSGLGRNPEASDCEALLRAAGDSNTHVALLAIDQLSRCQSATQATLIVYLLKLVQALPSPPAGAAAGTSPGPLPWHRAAHAIVALAHAAPDRARAELGRFASSAIWQARMYAARSAAILKDANTLRKLAGDTNDNVRNAAVSGLSEVEQHGADDVYVAQLARNDGQLLMTAARALRGSRNAAALPALFAALAAQSKAGSDTSRDARRALLERIGELGSAEHRRELEPLLSDFDPRVATAAAAVLTKWTGTSQTATLSMPKSGQLLSLTVEEVRRLEEVTAVVRLKGGGTFTLSLLAKEAPVTAASFARLVECGYYNGLTFHRVEPNFVVQGGSPGANEYAGYKRFMRDETGLASNRRGTVGLSTRGRDTGDAQWYINLVDNARLDHNYTVFATIVSGMEVADSILEGEEILDIRITDRRK